MSLKSRIQKFFRSFKGRHAQANERTKSVMRSYITENSIFIALGSNVGDSREIISRAIGRLQKLSNAPLRKSSLWKSTPVDCPPGSPDFVNAVVGLLVGPEETPETLLQKLQALERDFGRAPKKVLNEPRPLDLDLIAFRAEIRNSPRLTLPHPRAHLRKFVLQPLAEIAPDLILPGQSQTVSELLKQLASDEVLSRIEP